MKKALLLLILPLLLSSCGSSSKQGSSSLEIPVCTIDGGLRDSLDAIVRARSKYDSPLSEGEILAKAGYKTGERLEGNEGTVLRLLQGAFSSLLSGVPKVGYRVYAANFSPASEAEYLGEEDEKALAWLASYGLWGESEYKGSETIGISFTKTLLQRIYSYLGAKPEDDYFTYVNSDRLFDSSLTVRDDEEYYKQYFVDEGNIDDFYVSFLNEEAPALYEDFTKGAGLGLLKDYADKIVGSSVSDFWSKATEVSASLGSYFFSLSSVYSPEDSPSEKRVSLSENGTIKLFEKASENQEALRSFYASFGLSASLASSLAASLPLCLEKINNSSFEIGSYGEGLSSYLAKQAGENSLVVGSNLSTLKAMGCLGEDLSEDNLLCFKAYFLATLGYNYRSLLSQELRASLGFEDGSDPKKDFLSTTKTALSGYFVNAYSSSEKGKKSFEAVTSLGKEIILTIKDRLSENAWLSEAGQKAVAEKLMGMDFLLGGINEDHPSFYGSTDASSLFSSLQSGLVSYWAGLREEIKKSEDANVVGLIYGDVFMPNAMHAYAQNTTDLTLGLLTSYGKDVCELSDEDFYGAFSTVLAHEITHSLDAEGVYYGASGEKLGESFLGEEDKEAYANKQEKVRSLHVYEPLPGIKQDSSATISEDLADLGALLVSEQIYKKKAKKVDWEAYYKSIGRHFFSTCSKYSWDKTYRLDVHSFGKARVDALLANSANFLSVYNVGELDGMYASPEERVVIW